MNFSKELIDHLRSGGIVNSHQFIIASSALNDEGVWLCGADYMADKLVQNISDAALQIIDAIDGKGLFAFERNPNTFITLSFDFDTPFGALSMRVRNPIWIGQMPNKERLQVEFNKNKVVPLPPEFESPCSAIFSGKLPSVVFYADGTFKLIKK